MKKFDKLTKSFSIVLGLISIAFFTFDYGLFARLKPKMTLFEEINNTEETLLILVGIGLILYLAFCILSLYLLAKFIKMTEKVSLVSLLLVASIILSLIFSFSDIALLNDITKQYKLGMDQPEWILLYPIMAFQLISAIALSYFLLFKLKFEDQITDVAQDSNVFIIVQFVGIICGLAGLAITSLGFVYPRGWSLVIHSTITTILVLMPYILVVLYWVYFKLKEKSKQLYDEKQLQDIYKSAVVTLFVSVAYMVFLFAANYNNLTGVVSVLWLPLYLFFVLLFFSLGNFYFSGKY